MASKKASASSPLSARIASASAGEVRGPVATMTLSQSSGGRPAISPRSIVISGSREAVAVDRERAACRYRVPVGG